MARGRKRTGPLVHGRFYAERPRGWMYDLHPGGDRFLMLQLVQEGPEEAARQDLRVVVGWLSEVKARLAASSP